MPFQETMRFGFWQRWSLWRPRSALDTRPGLQPGPPPRSLHFRVTTQPTLSTTSIFSEYLSACLLGRATSQPVCTRGLANLTAAVASARPAPQFTDERSDPREAGHYGHGAGSSGVRRRQSTLPSFLSASARCDLHPGPNMFLENRTGGSLSVVTTCPRT